MGTKCKLMIEREAGIPGTTEVDYGVLIRSQDSKENEREEQFDDCSHLRIAGAAIGRQARKEFGKER
ncbi:unnamed protein product [Linum trigynum]|uniref:Uncharacterized protein n=1 Tax=Linum trigynum TaxID=586398 RepID=A0AAV2G5Z0_9ROSI